MKIFDTFTFFNEKEILELRLMELYDFVDYFVIAEANKTHAGNPKEFVFEQNKELYKPYLDKIIYVKVTDLPGYSTKDRTSQFAPLYFQWNTLMRGLGKAEVGDKILFSDCDEIPNVETVKTRLNDPNWVAFQQILFYYYVNCKVNQTWRGTVLADFGTFESFLQLRFFLRKYRNECQNGGWHYSYMATPEQIFYKADNIAEREGVINRVGNVKDIAEKMATQRDVYGRGGWRTLMQIVDISNNKPKSLDKWLEKYPQFFYKNG